MKKIMLFAAACVALAACTKNIDTPAPEIATAFEKGQKVTLTVNAGEQTKVTSSLDGSTGAVDFKWETGDKIKVTVGTESAEFTLKTGAGESSATFEGTMPAAGETFGVQYPVVDPDLKTQTYVANALPKGKMKMAATGCTLDTPFTLTPQYAALRLNLWGSKTVGKIVVIKIDSTNPSFTLDCGTGVTTGITKADSTAFFIVVTEGSFKFSAEIFDNAATPASICKFETTNTQTFTAGQIQNMPAKEVKEVPGFSVSATKKVLFSKGNLYWDGSALHLEANQYDFPSTMSASHINLFRWSTTIDLSVATGWPEDQCKSSDKLFCDGSDAVHTLTVDGQSGLYAMNKDEWTYLINTRTNASSLKKNGVTVAGKSNCLIIAPDNYSGTIANNYTAEDWATAESQGLVCLPAAGLRQGSSGTQYVGNGYYWTSSRNPYSNSYAVSLYFTSDTITPADSYIERSDGRCLRLVYTSN